jgi:hypothetical protein
MSYEDVVGIGVDSIYSFYGVDAVFGQLMGDDISCRIIIDRGSDYDPGGVVMAVGPQTVISYRRSDIDRRLRQGETFTVGGSTVYTVRNMAEYPSSWTDKEGRAVVTEA